MHKLSKVKPDKALAEQFLRGLVMAASTVCFITGARTLPYADAIAILKVQANWIRQFPEVSFKVFGHTDAVGSNGYNQRLGKRRANAVVNFLVSQGISRKRLAAVVSFGETRPLIVTQGRERLNRRTVTEVSGFVKTNPLVLNGKYAEIIFREYVDSATERPPNNDAGLTAIAGQAG